MEKNGLFTENGELIYYKDGLPYHAGLIKENDDLYYIGKEGRAVRGKHKIHTNMTNGLMKRGIYIFGDDYKMVKADPDKNGLFRESGKLVYYRKGNPFHAGVVKDGDDIYYIGSQGYAVKGECVVHHEMANDILKSGTYTFGDDYKLKPRSYVAPKKKKKKTGSKKKKVKLSTVAQFVLIIGAAVLLIGTVLYTVIDGRRNRPQNPSEHASTGDIVLPTFEKEVLLSSNGAKEVYDGKITVAKAVTVPQSYQPFVFDYKLTGEDGRLFLSESPDLRDAKEFVLSAEADSLTVDNLKTGTPYYYKVNVGRDSYQGYFLTAESTRFVILPGVANTRDIGGYTTLDGKKVKQGVLIRGSEIDGLTDSSCFLQKDAIDAVKETFGFVYDFDLRESALYSGVYQTRFGKDVTHRFFNLPSQQNFFSPEYQTVLREIFKALAAPQNYPMYMHCTHGADRTGIICYLLEGVLNLPEDVMQTDYQLSGYTYSDYASSTSFHAVCGGIEGYEGDTLQEKIVSYLTSPEVGVTPEEIASIRDIFLEK